MAGDLVHGLERDGREGARGSRGALKHVHLEMGGKNAIIVMDDADLDLAARGDPVERVRHDGAALHRTSRLIVHEGRCDAVAERLVERAKALRLGHGLGADARSAR